MRLNARRWRASTLDVRTQLKNRNWRADSEQAGLFTPIVFMIDIAYTVQPPGSKTLQETRQV